MTTRSDNRPLESTRASWADVIKASESHSAQSAGRAASAPPAPIVDDQASSLHPGDVLVDAKFGRCTVHRISEGVIHMARETGRVIRVRQDMLPIRPLGIETLGNKKSRRVFTTSTEQL